MQAIATQQRLGVDFVSRAGCHRHWSWLAPGLSVPHIPSARDDFRRVLTAQQMRATPALRAGRFYPSALLGQWAPAPILRVVTCDGVDVGVDFNPPLTRYDYRQSQDGIALDVAAVGTANQLVSWAGMEAPLETCDTDFFVEHAMQREDESDDRNFYSMPRFLMHIDMTCAARLASLYCEQIALDSRVLDLMASWCSHLPDKLTYISGLGLNADELSRNSQLSDFVVQNLNQQPLLPYDDASFDAVVITASIEYLTQPQTVLRETRRVLRPGGKIIVSFSNRYFSTKAIHLWTMLHPVERLGWVLSQLTAAGFEQLNTHVEYGLQRAANDRYSGQLPAMDPLFAAWGRI